MGKRTVRSNQNNHHPPRRPVPGLGSGSGPSLLGPGPSSVVQPGVRSHIGQGTGRIAKPTAVVSIPIPAPPTWRGGPERPPSLLGLPLITDIAGPSHHAPYNPRSQNSNSNPNPRYRPRNQNQNQSSRRRPGATGGRPASGNRTASNNRNSRRRSASTDNWVPKEQPAVPSTSTSSAEKNLSDIDAEFRKFANAFEMPMPDIIEQPGARITGNSMPTNLLAIMAGLDVPTIDDDDEPHAFDVTVSPCPSNSPPQTLPQSSPKKSCSSRTTSTSAPVFAPAASSGIQTRTGSKRAVKIEETVEVDQPEKKVRRTKKEVVEIEEGELVDTDDDGVEVIEVRSTVKMEQTRNNSTGTPQKPKPTPSTQPEARVTRSRAAFKATRPSNSDPVVATATKTQVAQVTQKSQSLTDERSTTKKTQQITTTTTKMTSKTSASKPTSSQDDEIVIISEIIRKKPSASASTSASSITVAGRPGKSSVVPRLSKPTLPGAIVRPISHSTRSVTKPPFPQENYFDALSYHLAETRKINFREPECVVSQKLDNIDSSNIFRFVSYNILSQDVMGTTGYLYRHLPINGFSGTWPQRWKLLKFELGRLAPDILCLQEVDGSRFSGIRAGLGNKFSQMFMQRTDSTYGVAIMWNTKVFRRLDYVEFDYVDQTPNSPYDKGNVGQVVRFLHKKTNKEVVVANTHIYFNPKRGDVKLGQIAILLANIDKIRKDGKTPVIMAGDFNIEPFSPLYDFLSTGVITFAKGYSAATLSGQLAKQRTGAYQETRQRMLSLTMPSRVEGGSVNSLCKFVETETGAAISSGRYGGYASVVSCLKHSFRFAPVYDHVLSGGESEVSTFHADYGCPDHIFYTVKSKNTITGSAQYEVIEEGLSLIRRLTLPTLDEIHRYSPHPWPNEFTGSDHIPLLADFAFL